MFGVVHMDGSADNDPPVDSLSELYDELHSTGIIDGNVAVIHDESGWAISAHRDGRLVIERLNGQDPPQHMFVRSKEHTLAVWRRLIDHDLNALMSEPWKPGYG